MDVPPKDSPDIADLRAKGAIIFAIATAAKTGIDFDEPPHAEVVAPGWQLRGRALGRPALQSL